MPVNKAQKDLWLAYGILERWHDMTFKDFTNCPEAKAKIIKSVGNNDMHRDGVGLYLWGANGVGKTLALNCAFKMLLANKISCRIVTLSTLVTLYTGAWYAKEDRNAFYDSVLNVPVLGIEEIGKEYKSNSDLACVALDSIVRYRVQRKKPTWFTTNVDPIEIKKLYTEDIASMLREVSIPVQVTGIDWRKDKIQPLLEKTYL